MIAGEYKYGGLAGRMPVSDFKHRCHVVTCTKAGRDQGVLFYVLNRHLCREHERAILERLQRRADAIEVPPQSSGAGACWGVWYDGTSSDDDACWVEDAFFASREHAEAMARKLNLPYNGHLYGAREIVIR